MPDTATAGPHDLVRCPVDGIDFHPYYSDGVCPVCQWVPVGVEVTPPWWFDLDVVWKAVIAVLVVSVIMAVVVIGVFYAH